MIGGFIVTGNDAKRVIIRGLGPSLASAGITNAVNDPILRLYGPNGSQIAVNDNWKDIQQTEIIATGVPPQNDREAAIVATLAPAAYTATLAGAAGGSGVGLGGNLRSQLREWNEARQSQHPRLRAEREQCA